MEPFNLNEWYNQQNVKHISRIMKDCSISEEESRKYFYDFVKPKLLYHYPEDSDTLKFAVDAYNYFKK